MLSATVWSRQLEHQWDLVTELLRAELKARHFKYLLGPMWWLLDPILYTIMYFFLTVIVMRSRGGFGQLLFLLTMVIFWRYFSRSIDLAPLLVFNYQWLLKQTNISILPVFALYLEIESALFLFGLAVLFAAYLIVGVPLSWTWGFLPLILATQLSLTIGIGSLLATAGAYVRDLLNIVPLLTGLWFYVSPGIYSVSVIPAKWLRLYKMNPFATILPAYRAALLDHTTPDVPGLLFWLVIGTAISVCGLWLLHRTRRVLYKLL